MFKLNFKIALRNLWKHKGFTIINVGGLAIGLASCMVLLLYVAYEWGYDKQFGNYKETYIVYNNQKADGQIFSLLIANVIAFPLGYVIINNWLARFDFRIGISILPFAVAFSVSLLIAIVTVSVQSFKVATANPVDALKYE